MESAKLSKREMSEICILANGHQGAVGKKKSSYKSLGKFHLGPLIHNLRKHCPEEFMVSFAGFEACGIQYHVCFLNYGPEVE